MLPRMLLRELLLEHFGTLALEDLVVERQVFPRRGQFGFAG